MSWQRRCIVCGKIFTSSRRNAVCCSKECRSHYGWHYKPAQRENNIPKPRFKKVNQNLDSIAKEARAAGMSYGQYVAMKAAEDKTK